MSPAPVACSVDGSSVQGPRLLRSLAESKTASQRGAGGHLLLVIIFEDCRQAVRYSGVTVCETWR